MMRRLLPLMLLLLGAALLWSGCNDDVNRVPSFTRVASDVDCGPAPLDVQFVAIATGGDPQSDPTGGNLYLQIRWDFGDGQSATGSVTNHTFTEPGIYDVLVTVTDDDGDRAAVTLPITVEEDSLSVSAAPRDTTVWTNLAYFRAADGTPPTPGASNGGTPAGEPRADVAINEVMAFNETAVQDPDFGEYSPWVELLNTTDVAIDLADWSLSDDPAEPDKWHFPALGSSIPAHGYLLVWLDGQDSDHTHAGFRLADGYQGAPADFTGVLFLHDAEGNLVDAMGLRGLDTDVSFGCYPDGSRGQPVPLRSGVELCGFDSATQDYRRFDFVWVLDDAAGTSYDGRLPLIRFDSDVGLHRVVLHVFDTQQSVSRSDTVTVLVQPVTPAR